MSEQRCYRCKQSKPFAAFHACKSRPNGYQACCKACCREYSLKQYSDPAHRAKRKQRARNWNVTNYDRWYACNRRSTLAKKYGLTPTDYDRMETEQDGCCAICRTRPEKKLVIDHDHITGKVRGLLCSPCNFMIGHSYDSSARLRAGADYLEDNR